MDAEKLRYITSQLEYPEETALTEYKSAVAFDPRSEFGAKLIKHILGLANAGGGYIIIGFQEDDSGKLLPDSNLKEDISRSYETTRLSQSVDSFLRPGQRIELLVHKVSWSGLVYPVISIDGFKGSPYFCGKEFLSSTKKAILAEGAIYVRDAAAKTVVVAGPEHWNSLLKTAVSQRQTGLIENLRSLLGELGISLPGASSDPKTISADDLKKYESESKTARAQLAAIHANGGIFEVEHYPRGVISKTWNQVQLVAAAQKAAVRKTGWPIGIVMNNPDFAPKPSTSGIRAIIDARGLFDYWSLDRRGGFYLLRLMDEDSDRDLQRKAGGPWIYFDTRIWRVAETLLHCSNLYRDLELQPEAAIAISITHSGLKNRFLGVAAPMRPMAWKRKSEENEVTWSKSVPLGSIEATLRDLTREATNELFTLFEFWQPSDQLFNEIFDEFIKSSV